MHGHLYDALPMPSIVVLLSHCSTLLPSRSLKDHEYTFLHVFIIAAGACLVRAVHKHSTPNKLLVRAQLIHSTERSDRFREPGKTQYKRLRYVRIIMLIRF